MRNVLIRRMAGAVAAMLVTAPAAIPEVIIAERGRPRAVIVVASKAQETEIYAAEELALHLRAATGGIFDIFRGTGAVNTECRLLVGPAAARAEGVTMISEGRTLDEWAAINK